jgi:hypothetical protein
VRRTGARARDVARWKLWGDVVGMEEAAEEAVLYERGGGLELEVEEVEVVGVGVVLREMKGGDGGDMEVNVEESAEALRLCGGDGGSEVLCLLRELRQELV